MGAVVQIAGHEESHPPNSDAGWLNDGWIEFENGDAGSRRGEVALKSVLQTLVEREGIRPIPAAVPVSHN